MHVARPVQVSFGLGVVTMEQQWRARFVQLRLGLGLADVEDL